MEWGRSELEKNSQVRGRRERDRQKDGVDNERNKERKKITVNEPSKDKYKLRLAKLIEISLSLIENHPGILEFSLPFPVFTPGT